MDANTITSLISSSINNMFNNIFSSIDNKVYSALDDFTFISSDILNDSYFSNIFGLNSNKGILVVANALIFGYLLYYAFKLLLAHLGVTETERPTSFLLKLILCSICMNFSLFICDEIIYFTSIISSSIRQIGENLFHCNLCFSELVLKIDSALGNTSNSIDIFSVDGIIKSLISISLLNLVITYAIRYVLIKVFVLISPFTFLSLCNKNTAILFHAWLKSFVSLLLVQIFVSIILLLIFSLNFSTENVFSKFILLGAIFILIKANSYIKELLGGISTDVNIGINNLKGSIMN